MGGSECEWSALIEGRARAEDRLKDPLAAAELVRCQ